MRNPSVLQWIDRGLIGLSRAMAASAMALLAVMTFLIALQVVSRNFFNLGLPWADELARFSGIAAVFFAVPQLQYQGKHIAVDLFSSKVPGLAGRILKVISEAVVLGFCLLFLASLNAFLGRAAHFSTPALGLPNWVFYAPVLAGMVLCTLVAALRLFRLLCCPQVSEDPAASEGTPS